MSFSRGLTGPSRGTVTGSLDRSPGVADSFNTTSTCLASRSPNQASKLEQALHPLASMPSGALYVCLGFMTSGLGDGDERLWLWFNFGLQRGNGAAEMNMCTHL
jgi:hypothetical protein